MSTAANMCKKLPSDAADFVMEAVPLLTNLLQYHDAKVKVILIGGSQSKEFCMGWLITV